MAAGRAAEFEELYGPEGGWVRLFRSAPGYRRTELLRDLDDPSRYLTIDYWDSREAWESFRAAQAAAFEALDARGETLTVDEAEIGRYRPVG